MMLVSLQSVTQGCSFSSNAVYSHLNVETFQFLEMPVQYFPSYLSRTEKGDGSRPPAGLVLAG